MVRTTKKMYHGVNFHFNKHRGRFSTAIIKLRNKMFFLSTICALAAKNKKAVVFVLLDERLD
jgi:hypothetical protein